MHISRNAVLVLCTWVFFYLFTVNTQYVESKVKKLVGLEGQLLQREPMG